jgi:ParB family chromosome partitioning protein
MLQMLRLLGVQKVMCRIAPKTTPAALLFSLRILHGLDVSQTSPILQAHLLTQAQTELPEQELLGLLDLMGHNPHRTQYDELTRLLQLPRKAIFALHRGTLTPRSGKMLRTLPHTDQEALVSLIEAYRAGGSKQSKLIEMVYEITMREQKPVSELIGEWLPGEQEGTDLNRPQQLQEILQALTLRCWPQRTQMEKDFQGFIQELRLPEDACVVASPSFEDDSVELRLRFANCTDLRERWQQISRLIR